MPAKSAAYEEGIREGRAMAARSRNPEASEPEEEEEEEMDMAANHSRKRSAKGAKHTKPAKDGGVYGKKPMDAECGCGRKGKCDGNCGSMRKRSDSLTPLEYLDACELGIQDRSTAYIRARLDAAERLDLKCGKGSISEGEKCTKGAAQKVQPKKPTKFRNSAAKKALVAGAVIGGAALLGAGLDIRGQRKRAAGSALSAIKRLKAKGNDGLIAALKSAKNSNQMFPDNPLLQQKAYANIMRAKTTRGLARQAAKEALGELKTKVPMSPARRRAARRRGDTLYAAGFSLDSSSFDI
jgi:hypothetical protein